MKALITSASYERAIRQKLAQTENPNPFSIYGGVQIVVNNALPIYRPCKVCDGTGEGGDEATYCPVCVGRGGIKIIAATVDLRVYITEPLPRKFEPHWPRDVLVPLRRI